MTSSAETSRPMTFALPPTVIVSISCDWDSGLQHHWQRRAQPLRKTIVRIPGPSWMEYFWMSKMRPVRRR